MIVWICFIVFFCFLNVSILVVDCLEFCCLLFFRVFELFVVCVAVCVMCAVCVVCSVLCVLPTFPDNPSLDRPLLDRPKILRFFFPHFCSFCFFSWVSSR